MKNIVLSFDPHHISNLLSIVSISSVIEHDIIIQ